MKWIQENLKCKNKRRKTELVASSIRMTYLVSVNSDNIGKPLSPVPDVSAETEVATLAASITF